MLATQYAEWYNIEAQRDGESDSQFKNRVSGALREAGNIIEAHEAAQDKRYDEIAAGIVATAPKKDLDPMALLLAALFK